jgi:hypothetical protein
LRDRRDPHIRVVAAFQQVRKPHPKPSRSGDGGTSQHRPLGLGQRHGRGPSVGIGRRPLQHVARARPHLRRVEGQGPPEQLRQLEQELVERERASHPAAECAQHLLRRGPFSVHDPPREAAQPLAPGRIDHGGDGRRDHRERQQRALIVRRAPPEAEDDRDGHGDDDRGKPGRGDRRDEQPVPEAAQLRAELPRPGHDHLVLLAGHGHLTPPSRRARGTAS